MKKKFILYSIVLLIRFLGTAQTQPKVSVDIDTTKIRIGEQINYQIIVENADKGIIFPKLQLDSLQKLEVVETFNIDTLKKRLIKKYKLTSFDSGSYYIPKQAVYIWNQPYYTDSIKIDVATVAVDTLKQKMYPIKAIQSEPYTFDDFKSYLWWIIGILLLLAIILYFVLRKKKTEEELIARIPPYQLAVSRLKELDKKQLWQKNKIKQYYIELTDIVRTYIEKELNIPALESTTDELMETLTDFNTSSSLQIPDDTVKKLRKLLQESDLVKFAKYKPLSNEIELHRNAAGFVIDEIKTTTPEEEELEEGQVSNQDADGISGKEVLVKEKVVKKKWNTKRIIITTIIIIALAGITIAGYYMYKGYNYAKENILGDSTKELLDAEWYTSSYGHPAITIETPKILKSQKVEVPAQFKNLIEQISIFNYGGLLSTFQINVASTSYTDKVETFSLEGSANGSLKSMESKGATFSSAVKEPIFIGTREGLKITTDYDYENPLTKKKEKGVLIMVIVGNKKGVQQVVISYRKGDDYGKQIAERIINSIEIDDEALE